MHNKRMDCPSLQDASLNLLWIARVFAFVSFLLLMAVPFSGHCDVNMIVIVLSFEKAAQAVWWACKLQGKAAASAKSNHAESLDSTPAWRDRCQESRTRRQPRPAPGHAAAHATVNEDTSYNTHLGRSSVRHRRKMQRPSKKVTALNNDSQTLVSDAASHDSRGKASVHESDHAESAGLKSVRHNRSHNHITMTMHAQDKGKLQHQPALLQAASHGMVSVDKFTNHPSPKYYSREQMQCPSKTTSELNNDNSQRWVSYAASHFPRRVDSHSSQKVIVQSTSPVTPAKKPQPKRQEHSPGLPALQVVRERSLPLERTFCTTSPPPTFPKKSQPNGKCQANGSSLPSPRHAREKSPPLERTLSRATFSLDGATTLKSSGVRFYADVVSRARAAQLASHAQAAQRLSRCTSV